MRRIVAQLAWVCCLALLAPAAGCRNKADETPSAASPAAQPATQPAAQAAPLPVVIGVSLASLDGARQTQLKADLTAAAAAHPELPLTIVDAQGDDARQAAQIEEFTKLPVRALIVSPVDAQSLTEPAAKAFEAGIPVVVLNRALVGDKYSCYIAPDAKQAGREAGKWLAGRLHGKGKIVEIKGPVDLPASQSLHDAFHAALGDPAYHFVFDDALDPPRIDGAKLMTQALARVQRIDAVFAFDDAAALAAYEVAKAAGRAKGVLFVGVGGLPDEGGAYVKNGFLNASIYYSTGGAEAIDAAVKLLRGEKPPKTIVTETRVLTARDRT